MAEKAENVRKYTAGNVQKAAAEEPSETAQKYAARIEVLFQRLARSKFRSRFALGEEDFAYIERKGMDTIRRHARDFVGERLAPAYPRNDGKQTPMRGHPVFIAQHATGTCCRGCLEKWHGIPKGRPLSVQEQEYIAEVIMAWIKRQAAQQAGKAKADEKEGKASAQGEDSAAVRAVQEKANANGREGEASAQGKDSAEVRAAQRAEQGKDGASAQGEGKKARRTVKKKEEKEEYVQLSLFPEE